MAKYLRVEPSGNRKILTALGSRRVLIILLSAVAVAAAYGTFSQARCGAEFAHWHVYRSSWFTGLLAALAVNIACAIFNQLPWRRANASMIATQFGFLLVLFGALLTRLNGIEGEVTLLEGASTEQLNLNQQSQITASWVDRPQELPFVFSFENGPNDWQRGTELSLGQVDGLSARVLDFFSNPQPMEQMVVDANGRGGPLIRFEVKGVHSSSTIRGGMNANTPLRGSLADVDYGAEVLVGSVAVRLQRATSDAMLAEFLHPHQESLGTKGVLTAYYEEAVERVHVDEQVGKTVKVGNNGAAVELVQYLANAKLDANGKFQSIGTDARNPLVELKVTLPGDEKPFRQVAFAKSPLLNFDGVYGRDCPVKFTYQHPQLKSGAALEFMQARDGKLYGRTFADGAYTPVGEMKVGTKASLKGGPEFTVSDYLPHARRDILFQRGNPNSPNDHAQGSPAAQVEVSIKGTQKTLWLQRDTAPYNVGILDMPAGQLRVRFTKAHVPLGFHLELVNAQRNGEQTCGDRTAATCAVRLIDTQHRTDVVTNLLPGQPASCNSFRIYPAQIQEAGHGKQMATMNIVYDPGRAWKIGGSLLMCLSICGLIKTNFAETRNKSTQIGPRMVHSLSTHQSKRMSA